MSPDLAWNNLLLYTGQVAVVAIAAAGILALVRLRAPAARLLYWQCAIAACLLLPLIRPWKMDTAGGGVTFSTAVIATGAPKPVPAWHLPSFAATMLAAIAIGIVLRLVWLAIGLRRLRGYRLESRPFEAAGSDVHEADVRISDKVSSPVTFGYRNPVVLLPPRFGELDPLMQQAILRHEVVHVRRRDWLWTLAEEVVRAALWFHPGVWWMIGEAQLAREQAVDLLVIEMTGAREKYLDALLAVAGGAARLDLAPAPLFLKRRRLRQRVAAIVKEVRMSRMRLISAFAAGAAMLAGVCWMVTGALPLIAAPQNVNDSPGVTVEPGGAPLIHRAPVMYPEDAIAKGVQGNVVVQARLGSDGSVVDASVVTGPDELRKAALESVLNWHFDHAAAGSTQQVTIGFTLPTTTANAAPGAPAAIRVVRAGQFQSSVPPGGSQETETIRSIDINGLSDQATSQLLEQLPVHTGDKMTVADMPKIAAAVRAFDSHLMVSVSPGNPTGFAIRIQPQSSLPPPMPWFTTGGPVAVGSPGKVIRVGGNVQQANLISKVTPVYPPDAKAARVQGTVQFEAIIAPDGHVQNLNVVSGPPLLVNSAMEAVKQWIYKPTLLNGQPVTVITQVDVNYTLSQ